jgi:hypothetical protein
MARHHFRLVFLSLLTLTTLFALGSAALSMDSSAGPQAAKISDGLLDLTKLCVGTLAGLIGARALH